MKRLFVLALVVPLAACSGGTGVAPAPNTPAASSAAPVAQATSTTNPAPTLVDDWSNAVKFSELALAGKHEGAKKYVSPGSAADRYLIHQIALREAVVAAGSARNDPLTPTVNRDSGTISFSQGEGEDDTVWKDFTYDGGKVSGWTIGETPLSSRVWTKDAEASLKGVNVKLVSAYQNDSALWVILDVTSADRDLKMDYSPALTDAKKRQREAATVVGPDEVKTGTSAYVAYAFEGAAYGGTLTYALTSTNFSPLGKVTLAIG